MANQVKRSHESAPIIERHGKTGELRLSVTVLPWLKDSLIDIAEARGVSVNELCASTLAAFVVASTPKPRHRRLLGHRRRAS